MVEPRLPSAPRIGRQIVRSGSVVVVVVVALSGAALAATGLLAGAPRATPPSVARPSPDAIEPTRATVPTPLPSSVPSTAGADEIVQATLGWWELSDQAFEAAAAGEAPPPDPARRLRVGTLDGRVVSDLALAPHAFAAGPFGTNVLAGHDTGSISELFVVSALDGSRGNVFLTDAIVPIASFGPDGSLYFVRVDRGSGTDDGVWVLPPGGGSEGRVVAGPLGGGPIHDSDEWRMAWMPNAAALVVQWCSAEAMCLTHVIDPASAALRSSDALGPLLGVGTGELLVGEADTAGLALAALDTLEPRHILDEAADATLVSIGTRPLIAYAGVRGIGVLDPTDPGAPVPLVIPGGAGPATTNGALRATAGERGASLPRGWTLLWPQLLAAAPVPGAPIEAWSAGTLLNVVSGERLAVPSPEPILLRPECRIIPPHILPGGLAPGASVISIDGGLLYQTWSSGANRVVEATGRFVLGPISQPPAGAPHTVRGHAARVAVLGDERIDEVAITWEQDGCPYTLWLPAGTLLQDAIDYATRF